MSMELQVIAAVVVADALVVAVSIWMDWTPLTNRARRKYLYEKLNLKM